MAKTLADMTAEERAECVGMWASHQGHEDKNEPCGNLGIISEIDRDYAWVAFPKESAETYVFDFEDLIPSFDLPRAWTPDGDPVPLALAEETWEYSAQDKRGEDWETFTNSETHIEEWWADKDDAEWAAIISQEQGSETRIVRRRVSTVEVCCQS